MCLKWIFGIADTFLKLRCMVSPAVCEDAKSARSLGGVSSQNKGRCKSHFLIFERIKCQRGLCHRFSRGGFYL